MAYDPSASLKDRFSSAREYLVGIFPNQRRSGGPFQSTLFSVQSTNLDIDIALELLNN
jgi:hypothetical protein